MVVDNSVERRGRAETVGGSTPIARSEGRSFPVACPDWVPAAAVHYLAHTEAGLTIRHLARSAGCHASTVLRQVRRIEARRDDPLTDAALRGLGTALFPDRGAARAAQLRGAPLMDGDTLTREARRVLSRMAETGARLAVAEGMEKAVVVRDTPDGTSIRTAVLDAEVAQALALKEWIECLKPGRIAQYALTAAGRSALQEFAGDRDDDATGFSEAQARYRASAARRGRYCAQDTPLVALARRRDRDGAPFLPEALLRAGERLREDFELAQVGSAVTQNWQRFLTAGCTGAPPAGGRGASEAARERVAAALRDLGPGLGDVALRCCCYLEGLESAERRLGWSARSGKIVLRIALQRLKRHYDETQGPGGPMIG